MVRELVLVKGHCPGPHELERPEWRGSLEEWLAANPSVEPAQAVEIGIDLGGDGFSVIGGGAEAEFTLYLRVDWEKLVDALDEAEEEDLAREAALDHWAWAIENHEDGPDGDSRIGAGW